MLYELLVGALPFPTERLRGAGLAELQRMLREVEPPRPSSRLMQLEAERLPAGLPPTALRHVLQGDLDWLVLKAMEKDRSRRYASAEELVDDLHRFLEHQPLVAGPPSTAYRGRKLVRRHRGRCIAALLLLLTLSPGVAASTAYAFESDRERHNTTLVTRTATRVRELLENMLINAEPGTRPDPDLKVRDLLQTRRRWR